MVTFEKTAFQEDFAVESASANHQHTGIEWQRELLQRLGVERGHPQKSTAPPVQRILRADKEKARLVSQASLVLTDRCRLRSCLGGPVSLRLRDRSLGRGRQRGKTRFVVHSQVGQYLAIQFNPGNLQAVDEH